MTDEPALQVFGGNPGTFPTPTLKGNEQWLLARLDEVWSDHRDEPVTEQLKTEVLAEMSHNRYFNSAVVDFEIVNGRPANVTFHHATIFPETDVLI